MWPDQAQTAHLPIFKKDLKRLILPAILETYLGFTKIETINLCNLFLKIYTFSRNKYRILPFFLLLLILYHIISFGSVIDYSLGT